MEPFVFEEGNIKSFEDILTRNMDKPIKHFEHELTAIRTGRASTAIVEDISVTVESYNQIMPLRELATLSTPDSRLITIQPWDKSVIGDIEKSILASNIGLTPQNDGTLIRLQLPQMSSDRREELIKVLHKKGEETRIGVRTVRKEFHNQIRDTERKHGISEDFAKRLNDVLQKITDKYIKCADDMQNKKESELKMV